MFRSTKYESEWLEAASSLNLHIWYDRVRVIIAIIMVTAIARVRLRRVAANDLT